MKQTQEQIEKLKTLQESLDFYADVAENQLPALADKIDNIKLPEIDTTELAKQGENQDATNSKIYEAALLAEQAAKEAKEYIDAIKNAHIYAGFQTDDVVYADESFVRKTASDVFISALKDGFNNIKSIDNDNVVMSLDNSSLFKDMTSVEYIRLGGVTSCGDSPSTYSYAFQGCSNLKELCLPNCTKFFFNRVNTAGEQLPLNGCTSLEKLILPKVSNVNSSWNTSSTLTVGYIKLLDIRGATSISMSDKQFAYSPRLIDLIVGEKMTKSFSLSFWSASEALYNDSTSLLTPEDLYNGFTSNKQKLLFNIREHIAKTLNPSVTATITFSSDIKEAIYNDIETLNSFPSNWTIA